MVLIKNIQKILTKFNDSTRLGKKNYFDEQNGRVKLTKDQRINLLKKIDNKQIRTFFISLWAKYGQGQWELGLNKDIIILRIYHEFIMFYSSDGAGIYKMQEGKE